MSTVKQYDYLDRLTSISNLDAQARNLGSFAYAYNPGNQRTAVTNADSARWVYSYDKLGQVISGRKYWADGTPVTGQQFEYAFDDIGNRKTTGVGGDFRGQNLHPASYAANLLNQYNSRTVPGYVPMLGTANSNATVTLWGSDGSYAQTTRKGDYFRGEILVNNSTGAVWLTVTNLAVLQDGTNADIVSSVTGSALVPQTPEPFAYDYDGNLTSDGLWTLTWDAENRVTTFESASGLPPGAKRKVLCTYDQAWRRTEKITCTNNGSAYFPASTNRYVYDRWNLIARLDGGGNLLQTYAWGLDLSGSPQGAGGIGGLLWVTSHATPVGPHFVASDGSGNVSALVSASGGALCAQYEYGPFGEAIRATGPMAMANLFRFSTKYHDDETGSLGYGLRYFSLSVERWLSKDPINEPGLRELITRRHRFAAREDLNPYRFADNDGLNKYDKFGEKCCLLTWYSKDDTKGHSALQCSNTVYVSAWPSQGDGRATDPPSPVHWHKADDDLGAEGEGRPPDNTLCSDCIEESKVADWLADIKTKAPLWNPRFNNCSDYTLSAIVAGLVKQKETCCIIGTYPQDLLSHPVVTSPSAVELKLKDLNRNRCQRFICAAIPRKG